MRHLSPMETAIALALYKFNVSAQERANSIFDYFNGDCMELDKLTNLLMESEGYEATGLPFPNAEVYVQQAIAKYGEEAALLARRASKS